MAVSHPARLQGIGIKESSIGSARLAEGNAFCKKITYRSDEDPKSVLAQFRNDYYPRIAVTVDMIGP